MLKKLIVIKMIVLSLLLFSNLSADEIISVKLGYQVLEAEGSIAGRVNGTGQSVDVERDLNLDDSEGVTAEVALHLGDSRLSLNYLPVEFSGTGTLTLNGTFNGQAFSTNDSVQTDLDINIYDFGYTYYLINIDDLPARIQIGPELAVKYIEADIRFNDITQGFVETESVSAPIPTIGGRARIAISDYVGITGRIGYLEFDDNSFMDAEAQIEFSPLPLVGIYAGYRYFELKIDEDDAFVDTKFSGIFGGIMARF